MEELLYIVRDRSLEIVAPNGREEVCVPPDLKCFCALSFWHQLSRTTLFSRITIACVWKNEMFVYCCKQQQ